jgi:hypothetical protein
LNNNLVYKKIFENKMYELYDRSVFIHSFSLLISGPSRSGKTHLLVDILKNHRILIKPQLERIVYCYAVWQNEFDELKQLGVEFVNGMYDVAEFNASTRNLVIYDDLMEECSNDRGILDLFTRGSHHLNISVILLTQNLFSKSRYMRTISLNTEYLIIFNNVRDKSQFNHVARQIYPDQPKFLIDAYRNATSQPHGYLFIDLSHNVEDELRVQSNITNLVRVVYIKK